MWTYIEKENLDKYLNQYPQFNDFFRELVLFETPTKYFLPRLMYKNYPSDLLVCYNGKIERNPKPISFKFTGRLREEQEIIAESILRQYKQNNNQINGIIRARCGVGKTVLAVYLASKIGLKTCVVVDNTTLMEQWVQEFLKFTDLDINDIGLIKQKYMTTDKPVVITMVQTLLSKLKSNPNKIIQTIDDAEFGLVFYDEAHSTSSATKYAQSSILFRTKNIIGLSATPYHSGVMKILMNNTIGDILYETTTYDLKPIYNLIYYESQLSKKYHYVISKISDYITKKSFYNKVIIKSDEYKNVITNLVRRRYNEGHRILLLCSTKEQVKQLSESIENIGIKNRRFYGDEKEIDKTTDRVIVGTYKFIGKGFDFKELSSLILAINLAGKKSLIQVIGRILRQCDNKLQPVVDDLVDLSFPTLFLPDVKIKVSIIENEFKCNINQIKLEDLQSTSF